jgi:chemotaxis protein MotA
MKTGLGLIFGAVILVFVHLWNGGVVQDLMQPAPLVFVLLGTLLSTFLSAPSQDFKRALAAKPGAATGDVGVVSLKKELIELAGLARKEGFLGLDAFRARASRDSLREGIQYLISGYDQAAIRDLFDAGISRKINEAESSVRIWDIAAGAAPSIGALGATLGLLTALAKLDDPSQLGRGIASAMAAVLYGFFFANFVFSPLAARRRREASESILPEEMVKSAVLGIQEGLNPHLIEERLKQVGN